jgi:hypothetical protein
MIRKPEARFQSKSACLVGHYYVPSHLQHLCVRVILQTIAIAVALIPDTHSETLQMRLNPKSWSEMWVNGLA